MTAQTNTGCFQGTASSCQLFFLGRILFSVCWAEIINQVSRNARSPGQHTGSSRRLLRPERKEPGRFVLQLAGRAGDALHGTGDDALHGTQGGRWEADCYFLKKPRNIKCIYNHVSITAGLAGVEGFFPRSCDHQLDQGFPVRDTSHRLGPSLCWGPGERSLAALGQEGRGSGRARHVAGMLGQPWSLLAASCPGRAMREHEQGSGDRLDRHQVAASQPPGPASSELQHHPASFSSDPRPNSRLFFVFCV